MTTFLSDFTQSLNDSWQEIDIILTHAEEVQNDKPELYSALCRSATVLIVAHLEGFTKDLIKNIIKDINNNCSFSEIPIAIKRTYCKKYFGANLDKKDKRHNEKISQLIEKFEETGCSISYEPFLFPTNKNPNPNIIKTIFNNIGVNDVFAYLHDSSFETIFSDSYPDICDKAENLKLEVNDVASEYPYKITSERHNMKKKQCPPKTIWEEFLDQINKKRHSVAHGNDFNNSDDFHELQTRKIKVIVLQQLLILILCQKITTTPSE